MQENMAIVSDSKTEFGIEAVADQIIIKEDKFKSGYECSKCQGDAYLEEPCPRCNGTGKENIGTSDETLCRFCCPRNLVASGGMRPGKKLCDVCSGTGGILIAPEISQRRPTSGIIESIGPDVTHFHVGDRVLYSMFAGTAINFKQKSVIRIMHQHEIMARLHGVGKIGEWMR